jgi:hypothetical protein
MMSDWLLIRAKGRKVITITLRQSAYYPERNSHIDNWLRLANSLDPQQYCVIFVCDTEGGAQNTPQLDNFDCSIAASMSVPLRMALYELSFLCLGVNNGPMVLCWFNDRCKYITFKIITESVPQATRAAAIRYGFTPGATPAFAGLYQWWVWQDDTYPLIQEKVLSLLNAIHAETDKTLVANSLSE